MLSTPYSAANPSTGQQEGIVQGSGPQFASVVPGVPLYEHQASSRRILEASASKASISLRAARKHFNARTSLLFTLRCQET